MIGVRTVHGVTPPVSGRVHVGQKLFGQSPLPRTRHNTNFVDSIAKPYDPRERNGR